MIEIAASTLGFRHDTLDVALDVIAAQGFRTVDLVMIPSYCPHFNAVAASDEQKHDLQRKLKSLGLAVSTLNTGDGLLGIPQDRDKVMAYARASMQLASRLGAYGITIQSGVEPAAGQWQTVAKAVAADVRQLADDAADLGLELTLELHKTMLMSNSSEALALMALIDRPNVGVALDPSHITYAGEQANEVALKLGSHVKHVHLRDGVGKNIMVVPGDGTVDFEALATALRTIRYQHVAAIELEYEHARADQVRKDLSRAKAFLEKTFR